MAETAGAAGEAAGETAGELDKDAGETVEKLERADAGEFNERVDTDIL